ncbi:LysM peptidoglycan-binding domain-containing protein [Rhodovibrio salinarum]|uniref:LysM peptidoglycan-binding domain-containing protein n=1 Tax=Rhodovibrio salinarum TaxID=1087 RepID=UPI0004BA629B|nr:LysM peptidoglycan-binding domain-containing protein [Rhodovibrio salinarum]
MAQRAGWFDTPEFTGILPDAGPSGTLAPKDQSAEQTPQSETESEAISQRGTAMPSETPPKTRPSPARQPDAPTSTAPTSTAITDGGQETGRATSASTPDPQDTSARASRTGGSHSAAMPEDNDAGPETGPTPTTRQHSRVRDADSGMQVTVPVRDEEARAPDAQVTRAEPPQVPSFDIVRVERSGEAVIAGRAAPGSRVTVLRDGQTVARSEANTRGEFVAIPHRPLPSGQLQLTLRAEGPESNETRESERVVVIDIPRGPGGNASERAGQGRESPTQASGQRDGDGSARVATQPSQDGLQRTRDPSTAQAMRSMAATPDAHGDTDNGPGTRGDAPIAVLVPRAGPGAVELLQRPAGETGLEDRQLVLDAVQYTVDGGITIRGQAPAGALVVAYLNATELARTRASADGDWTMTPDAEVSPGLHTLRIDQLGPEGRVQASISTPFANQPMVDELEEDDSMVVIQPGDNLWTIARRIYGQGWEYTLIYRANRDQIGNPDLIYPGQVFVVPEATE